MMKKISLLSMSVLVIAICYGLFRLYSFYVSPAYPAFMREVGLGQPVLVPVSGTGSMYPTFPKGHGKSYQELSSETVATPSMYIYPSGIRLFDQTHFSTSLGYGDIVSFENESTRTISQKKSGEARGFVKRIIGLPGDLIELRQGIVYRNNTPLKEPYIARAQSTFGGEFLRECTIVQVSPNSLFVLGDNRKGSNDSRHDLGFVPIQDISLFLPYEKQKGIYDSQWHDASDDLSTSHKISLDVAQFMKLLNQSRVADKLTPLKVDSRLVQSARKRGETMLRTDDFSFEATKSGYTTEKAMSEAGYENVLIGELPVQGYYEADELYEYVFEFPNMRNFMLNPEYTDFGISEVSGNVNNCPTQVIVMHIGGYRPPDYSEDIINSWKTLLVSLKDHSPGWRDAREVSEYYARHKTDLDRMIELYDIRIKNIEGIVETMEANKYLSQEQRDYVAQDEKYEDEQAALAERLNQP